jgi:hypothetical protein
MKLWFKRYEIDGIDERGLELDAHGEVWKDDIYILWRMMLVFWET